MIKNLSKVSPSPTATRVSMTNEFVHINMRKCMSAHHQNSVFDICWCLWLQNATKKLWESNIQSILCSARLKSSHIHELFFFHENVEFFSTFIKKKIKLIHLIDGAFFTIYLFCFFLFSLYEKNENKNEKKIWVKWEINVTTTSI